MGDRGFRLLVLVLLLVIAGSQVLQGFEAVSRMLQRTDHAARIVDLERGAKKAIFENPDVKGIWQQIFLQEQIMTEYLKLLVRR